MNDTAKTDEAKTGKLWDMIRSIRVAMLTSDDGGHLRSRPMAASQKAFDGTLWFFTRADAHKVEEIGHESRVNVSYADSERQNYVSLSGRARLVRTPAEIKAHWSEPMRTWFPDGVADPRICLLKVEVEQAEYWDAPSSTMVYLAGYAQALVTGKSPDPGDNQKLDMAHGAVGEG